MDRKVPQTASKDIALYTRTYYSLLRSTREVKIRTLIEAHTRIKSALHIGADSDQPDMAAFIYTVQRLPGAILANARQVVMGLSVEAFIENGYGNVEQWEEVTTPARRRRTFYNGKDTLAVFIASRSDIDDLIPMLTAYQIERDKLHLLLNQPKVRNWLEQQPEQAISPDDLSLLSKLTEVAREDLERLTRIWKDKTKAQLAAIARNKLSLSVRNLAGSLADYRRATRHWWQHVERTLIERGIQIDERPIYFVSSNTHSLINLLSGFALQQHSLLSDYLQRQETAELQEEYRIVLQNNISGTRENFLYYIQKKYEAFRPQACAERLQAEQALGLYRIPSEHLFDIETQIFDLSKLNPNLLDPRLRSARLESLQASQALVVNIDFPLGMAAYQILSEISRNVPSFRGVYILGKSATLNGRIGDVMLPNVVHDEHSQNTYLFRNCLKANEISRHLIYGDLLDNQKAITVLGTFLQNSTYMGLFYEEGYTDMEMEAGPYLNCVFEMMRPKRYPENEVINLDEVQFRLGIVHYASDTPLSKGKNLGASNLSYRGVDATYACSLAVLEDILRTEVEKLTS